MLILEQNHCDTLLGVLQDRENTPVFFMYNHDFVKKIGIIEETHHAGSHATSAAPLLLCFSEGVRLCFVVSATDLFHLPVEAIWDEEAKMITLCTNIQ